MRMPSAHIIRQPMQSFAHARQALPTPAQAMSHAQMIARSTMADVTSMPNAHTTPQPMLSFVLAKWDTRTLLQKAPRRFAQTVVW